MFFCDLPSTAEKAKIWTIYQKHYQLAEQELPRSTDWTGARSRTAAGWRLYWMFRCRSCAAGGAGGGHGRGIRRSVAELGVGAMSLGGGTGAYQRAGTGVSGGRQLRRSSTTAN